MQIDRILYPVTALGPGERLVIWTIGCSKHCYKCANPELWARNPDKNLDAGELVHLITQAVDTQKIDGITITGGDPLEQIAELAVLLPLLREITDDVLIYTGYTAAEAEAALSPSEWEALRQFTDVLIDGPYINDLNDGKCVLRGSANQNIIFFDERKKNKYTEYMEKGRTVQNVFYNNKMISVGIHNRDL